MAWVYKTSSNRYCITNTYFSLLTILELYTKGIGRLKPVFVALPNTDLCQIYPIEFIAYDSQKFLHQGGSSAVWFVLEIRLRLWITDVQPSSSQNIQRDRNYVCLPNYDEESWGLGCEEIAKFKSMLMNKYFQAWHPNFVYGSSNPDSTSPLLNTDIGTGWIGEPY